MTEQTFTKTDAKQAFNTLAKFGLQEGSKLANKAGAKLDDWKQKLTQTKATDGERCDHLPDRDRCDHLSALEVPLSDSLVLGEHLKEAVVKHEVAKLLKHTYKNFDVSYSLGMLVGSPEQEVSYSNFVTLGDLQVRLVRVEGAFARVTLLETNNAALKAAGLGHLLLTNATVNAIVAVLPADKKLSFEKQDDNALEGVTIERYW